jgi:thiosulfate dehydrogenase [quinone] large subunit
MVRDFASAPLPAWSVWAFGAVLPTAELVIGLAILLGAKLRAALFLGALLIAALVLGTCLRQQWELAGVQMLYALIYFVLAARAGDARCSIDGLLAPLAPAQPGRVSGGER